MNTSLEGTIALVTGASRGAGLGIAIGLGSQGATVYVTGRTLREGDAPLPGTIGAAAQAVSAAGGKGIAVACDHSDDEQVAAVFAQIEKEQGQLDILVNNATFLHDNLTDAGSFHSKPLGLVDILDVGLRSAYVASWHAAQRMAKQASGLITFVSSFGGNCYMHGPAYGAQKTGVDRFAWDMGHDLKPFNVAVASLWLGMQKTARTRRAIDSDPEKYAGFWAMAESPEFNGQVIAALYNDAGRMEKSGQVLITAELAQEYGVTDAGRQPPSHRDILGSPPAVNLAIVE